MADYQYQPDLEDPVSKLRLAMGNMDGEPYVWAYTLIINSHGVAVEAIRSYTIPDEKEDYVVPIGTSCSDADSCLDEEPGEKVMRSNLRLFPPPLFSRQGISQIYKYVFFQVIRRK